MTQANYLKSYSLSRKLCSNIIDYYKGNPMYPKNFWKKIELSVEKNEAMDYFYITSNLDTLFANVLSLEERYL